MLFPSPSLLHLLLPHDDATDLEEEDDDDMHKNFKNHMGVYKGRERGGERGIVAYFSPLLEHARARGSFSIGLFTSFWSG